MKLRYLFIFTLITLSTSSFSQNTYPKITGYVGIVQPIVTFSKDGTVTNFKDYYLVGLATGINIWKSNKIGFSFELIPYIKADNGTSKMSNFSFQPGVLAALGKGYTFAGRAAFETSGRYGITPVFNKVIKKNKNSSYYIAIPLPVRFGNDKPASFTIGFQFGIAF
jgi:hypothetical protein